MSTNCNKLYALLLICCMAGYIWLYINKQNNTTQKQTVEVCLIKHTTNIPCPSCGSTRSVILLSKGKFIDALRTNPLGYIIAIIMVLTPIWIFIDFITKKKTLLEFYKKTERHLKQPKFAVPLIILVIINWVWNIIKEL